MRSLIILASVLAFILVASDVATNKVDAFDLSFLTDDYFGTSDVSANFVFDKDIGLFTMDGSVFLSDREKNHFKISGTVEMKHPLLTVPSLLYPSLYNMDSFYGSLTVFKDEDNTGYFKTNFYNKKDEQLLNINIDVSNNIFIEYDLPLLDIEAKANLTNEMHLLAGDFATIDQLVHSKDNIVINLWGYNETNNVETFIVMKNHLNYYLNDFYDSLHYSVVEPDNSGATIVKRDSNDGISISIGKFMPFKKLPIYCSQNNKESFYEYLVKITGPSFSVITMDHFFDTNDLFL